MESESFSPRLTVVIPTMGRPIVIQTLKSLFSANGMDDVEVILAGKIHNAEITEQVEQLVAAHKQLTHLAVEYELGDSSKKKNAGLRRAKADLVAFIDDDVVVASDWPLLIVEPFEDPEVGLAGGPSLVPKDVGWMARLAGLALSSAGAGYVAGRYRQGDQRVQDAKWSLVIGCNMIYRKSVLMERGGFDPAFWPGEEMKASYDTQTNGHKIKFHHDAYVYHYPRSSFGRFWKQMHGYGATRIRLFRAGVEFEPTTIVPMVWVAALVLLGLGSFFSTFILTAFLMMLCLYVLVVGAITFRAVRETKRLSDLGVFFVIPGMHLSYGIAEWVEVVMPNKDLSEKTK